MADDRSVYVARPDDVAALESHWTAAQGGRARLVRLSAPFGGGRRAVANELFRRIRTSGQDVVTWRVAGSDQENGLQWLMRAYGALVTTLAQDPLLRGKVEMVLNQQLPSEPKRVQTWFQHFVASTKEAKPDPKTGQVQLRVSQDNPLIGLVEVVRAITRKIPVVFEVQSPYLVHSVLLTQLVEALVQECRDQKLLVILHDEPEGPARDASHPAPLLEFYQRRADDVQVVAIAPWGEAEVAAHLASVGKQGNAAGIAAIAKGRPGFVSELVEILEERGMLGADLSGVTLASLVPLEVDEDELEEPGPAEEGKPRKAGKDDAERIAFLAALLGQAFPSALVAEMAGFDRESVDDLIDAMGDLFEEVQFAESMNTWIYRFKRGSWREGILERNDTDEGHELARRVGLFMERFLAPRGIGFISRTCRIYAEHGAGRQAAQMRALAISQDDPNAWGLAYEMLRYFDEVPWSDALRRTVYTSLLDHMVASGQAQAAEQIHAEVSAWATKNEDRGLQAWLLLNGSKLDLRRQDLFRARDRARAALEQYEALGEKQRAAEVHAHLAAIALADGRPDDALAEADAALSAAMIEQADGRRIVPPTIAAQAEMIRGVVNRRKNQPKEAIEHFKRANEIAGNSGQGALAIDAGLSLGEAMLAAGQLEDAVGVLQRVLVATRQLGALPRERAAAELLGQAEASRRNFPAALQLAQRCAQISQQLGLKQVLPIDLYNVGFFQLAQNRGKDALPFFEQADKAIGDQVGHPLQRDLWYHGGIAALQAGNADRARQWLTKAVPLLGRNGDGKRLVTALDQLAGLEFRAGNTARAKELLGQAVDVAEKADLKDERRALQKRLESLGA